MGSCLAWMNLTCPFEHVSSLFLWCIVGLGIHRGEQHSLADSLRQVEQVLPFATSSLLITTNDRRRFSTASLASFFFSFFFLFFVLVNFFGALATSLKATTSLKKVQATPPCICDGIHAQSTRFCGSWPTQRGEIGSGHVRGCRYSANATQ